jgi:serine/threonine protein kinase
MTKPADSTKSEVTASHDGAETAGRSEKRISHRPGGPAALIGVTISGRYRIERLLGEGGMGAVYQAEHTHMRKRLAVKVLHPEMSRLPEVVARFEREAMAAAHIDHPNVATATDFGKLEDGSFFLVLEFVEGQSLRDALGKSRIELGRALHITHQIAAALQRAHAMGIVHRDLKPENVMLVDRDGDPDFVKVLDFGIAKVPVGALTSPASSPLSGGPAQPVLTQLGMVYGTPEYMAPEQALGQVVDARADLYALGVMTYEMLAGSRPFDHESKVSLLGMHVTARVPPFAEKCPEALVPPEVEAIVMKLLAKEASDRFADAKELIDAILNVLALLIERQRIDAHFAGGPFLVASVGSSPNLGSLPGGAMMSSRGVLLSSPLSMRGLSAQQSGQLPTVMASESGKLKAPGMSRRTAAIIAAIVGGLSIFAIVAVVFASREKKHAVMVDPDGGVVEVPSAVATEEPVSPSEESQIKAAFDDIAKGDYGSGITALTAVESDHMDRADIHRALYRAYMATKDTKNAMKEAGLLIKTDPSALEDNKVLEDIRNTAVAGKEPQEDAFALLEYGMGSRGIDILYEVAHAQWASEYPAASTRAQRTLNKPDIRARASPALAVTLDIRSANTCEGKKAYFTRARDVGDFRTAAVLRTYVPTRGCGFLGGRDCWTCMHKDSSLKQTLQAIDDRAPKR